MTTNTIIQKGPHDPQGDRVNSIPVFITGASGTMGRRLIETLTKRGHAVTALVRPGSEAKVSNECNVIIGDALNSRTYVSAIPPQATFVQLVGVAHPSPLKADAFRKIDLIAGTEAVRAAQKAEVRNFIYVSVAQPAPIMKDYIAVRAEVESALRSSSLDVTILRPWYVLGPGHWWPWVLKPFYQALERIPSMREPTRRLGLVTIDQMTQALTEAIETPETGVRIWDVPTIRGMGLRREELSPN